MAELFGANYLDRRGAVDKPLLARLAFSDTAARAKLEAAIHPLVRAFFSRLATARAATSPIVLEATRLVEAGYAPDFDLIVTVEAPSEARLERAVGRGLSRAEALALQNAMLPSGLLAAVSVALLCWLEPRRANGSLWGSRLPAGIHFAFGGMWLLAAAAVFGFRWGEIDVFAALPAITGLALLGCAGLAALILGAYALRSDRSGRQTGVARVTGDLIDQRDAPEVFDALDRWWASAGPEAMRRSATRVRAVRREVLARLRAGMLVTELDERAAFLVSEPLEWVERRR